MVNEGYRAMIRKIFIENFLFLFVGEFLFFKDWIKEEYELLFFVFDDEILKVWILGGCDVNELNDK